MAKYKKTILPSGHIACHCKCECPNNDSNINVIARRNFLYLIKTENTFPAFSLVSGLSFVRSLSFNCHFEYSPQKNQISCTRFFTLRGLPKRRYVSVTRWLDYLFHIWLFTTLKICHIA